MLNLNDREWKTFKVKNIFSIEKCKCSSVSTLKQGTFPYVGATNRNNGIMAFVEKKDKWVTKGNCIVFICDGQGSVGYSIYKKEDFIGSTTLKVGRSEHLNRYTAQFLVSALDKNRQMYSYGYKRNENRLSNESIMLPTADNGQPDYAFMEQYIKEREDKLKQKYIDFIRENYQIGEVIPRLEEKTWKAFYIGDIFDTFIPGKSKGLNHLKRAENGIPYLGATNSNNGVMCFVEDNNKLKQLGNAIGFIKNGNGSAGYSIYKKEDFVATSDIIFAYAEWLTPYIGLFITTTSDMSQEKYSHGYKWTRERLVKSTIMLPTTDEGSPDYEYMEKYIKAVMFGKYKKYLEYTKNEKSDRLQS